jgi:Ca2+-dependent lipid-binding protein
MTIAIARNIMTMDVEKRMCDAERNATGMLKVKLEKMKGESEANKHCCIDGRGGLDIDNLRKQHA